jgi:LPS O-antigen subunit length determinant protein (WzzB/FepE family)
MIHRILYSTLAFIIILCQSAFAAHRQDFRRVHTAESAVGTIQHVSRNTLEIFDEDRKESRRFIYMGSMEHLQVGERVRVFFEPGNDIIQIIKKMTNLDYRPGGQNLGYIYRK